MKKREKFSSMRTFAIGKYEICVFPGARILHTDKSGNPTGDTNFYYFCEFREWDEEYIRREFESWWTGAYNRYADIEEKITLWMHADNNDGVQGVILYNIGIRKVGQTHGVMIEDSERINGKYVSQKTWVDMDSIMDWRYVYSDEDNEYLDKVEAEVKRIGKGYDCNFRRHGGNVHHINGANHFCFSLNGDMVHPLSVGGSRFTYIKDFTREQFVEELKSICLTLDECNGIYKGIWNDITK